MQTQIIKTYATGRYVVRQIDEHGRLIRSTLNVLDDHGNLITVL